MKRTSIALTLTLLAWPVLALDPVVNFRNGGTGAYPEADPPVEWSVTKNVKWCWRAPLLGTTISSLIIVGDKIVTLARPMTVVCLDKNTGREFWRREKHLDGNAGETVRVMHAAIERDHRIFELNARQIGRGDGGASISRIMRALAAGKKVGADETAYYAALLAPLTAMVVDGEANRASYEKELAELTAKRPKKGESAFDGSGYVCGATPASDGKRVVAVFLPGLVVCYDFDGKLQWTHAVVDAKGRAGRGGLAVVPAMADGKVLIDRGNILQCLDAATGKLLWNREGLRSGDFGAAASSPVIGHGGDVYYCMYGQQGDVCRLDTGEEVVPSWWRDDPAYRAEMMERYWASSISADRKTLHGVTHAVRIPDDPAQKPVILWKLPIEYVGRKDKPQKVVGGNHQYCAPMVVGDKVFFLNTGGGPHRISVLDAETGKLLVGPITGGVPGDYNDPIVAGPYIYRFDDAGKREIRDPAKNFAVIGTNLLDPSLNAVPVFDGRRMYVRTELSLFCIEKPE